MNYDDGRPASISRPPRSGGVFPLIAGTFVGAATGIFAVALCGLPFEPIWLIVLVAMIGGSTGALCGALALALRP